MPVEVYYRIINQLQEIDFAGRISPYLMNEPLLDKRLPELIAYTRERCPESWIAINTNGDKLNDAIADSLFDAGLNSLDINAYDSTKQYEKYVALAKRLEDRRGDIAFRLGYSNPAFNGTNLARTTKIVNCRNMAFWSSEFRAKRGTPDMQNRSGNVPGARYIAEPLPLGCPRPFQQMYINHIGEALLCCNDWRFEVIMGDTATSSLVEIWQNHKYQAYRDKLQQKNRSMTLCKSCDYQAESSDWD